MLQPLHLGPLPDEPLVSVLMSNYNYGRYVGEAIRSVQAQSYPNFELLVCDDGSTDDSCEVIERMARQDARIRLFRQENSGQGAGFNNTFRNSRGQVVCLLDSDDAYLPNKLERVVQAFRGNPQAGFAMHRLVRVTEDRKPQGLSPLLGRMPSGWQADYVLRNSGILEYLPPCGGLCLRREVAERIFPLPETGPVRMLGDEPIMRLAPLVTNIVAIEEPLAEWRRHTGNQCNRPRFTVKEIDRALATYAQSWQLQHRFLESIDSELPKRLAPLEANAHVLALRYTRARLKGEECSGLYRELARHCAAASPALRPRWFWRAAPLLPRPLFAAAVNMLVTQNVLKQALGWLAGAVKSPFSNRRYEYPQTQRQ
jgi:glycosyltransferase involved in cell wall biosynthesis